jgi:hypothetical protein
MADDASERPQGQRFSHVYLRSPDLLQDSPRARRRVAALLDGITSSYLDGISIFINEEIGIDVIFGYDRVNWPRTIERLDRSDFLDLFTIVFRFLTRKGERALAQRFVKAADRIFREENLHYELDESGGVHFRVDAQFAATIHEAIKALGASRYGNAKSEFEKAMAALSSAEIDGKQGIRGIFNSVECVYKLMFPRAAKLTSADAIGSLQPIVQTLYETNATAQRATNKSIQSFGDWIDACHNYRHEEGVEEPSQPPLELAVELVSVGASVLRWLIDIDRQVTKKSGS